MILLYATFPSLAEAKKISGKLLSMRLIACANIIESSSIYRWKGRAVRGKEYIALVKTSAKKSARARKAILEPHSYEIPCVLEIQARANSAYEKWVVAQLK